LFRMWRLSLAPSALTRCVEIRQRALLADFHPIIKDSWHNSAELARFEANKSIACHRLKRSGDIRLRTPVSCANSSIDPGAASLIIRSSSRLPPDRILAKDSVDVNQTRGSSARHAPQRACAPSFLRTWRDRFFGD